MIWIPPLTDLMDVARHFGDVQEAGIQRMSVQGDNLHLTYSDGTEVIVEPGMMINKEDAA